MSDDAVPMDQWNAHLDRAWDLVARGDLASARRSAEECLALDAGSADAHYLMGHIQAQEGHPEEALESYEQAIELDETFYEALLNTAELCIHTLGNSKEGLKYVEAALDVAETPEERTDAILLRVDAHLLDGDLEAARKALRLLPDGPMEPAHLEFLVARAEFECGILEGVEKRLRRVIEREPHHADAHYYLGLALDARKETRDATVAFLQTRELDLTQPAPAWSLSTELFEKKVQAAIQRLSPATREALDGALVVVVAAPGAEVVADGVDPRALILLDALGPPEAAPAVGRLFVYQSNVERASPTLDAVDDAIVGSIERELAHAYPDAFPMSESP